MRFKNNINGSSVVFFFLDLKYVEIIEWWLNLIYPKERKLSHTIFIGYLLETVLLVKSLFRLFVWNIDSFKVDLYWLNKKDFSVCLIKFWFYGNFTLVFSNLWKIVNPANTCLSIYRISLYFWINEGGWGRLILVQRVVKLQIWKHRYIDYPLLCKNILVQFLFIFY